MYTQLHGESKGEMINRSFCFLYIYAYMNKSSEEEEEEAEDEEKSTKKKKHDKIIHTSVDRQRCFVY